MQRIITFLCAFVIFAVAATAQYKPPVKGGGASTSVANLWTAAQTFAHNMLLLKESGGNDVVTVAVQAQTGNGTLLIPDLGGSNDTIMTLGTTQNVSGSKTYTSTQFFNQGTLRLYNGANQVQLYPTTQTANNGAARIPDLAGNVDDILMVGTAQAISGAKTFIQDTLFLHEPSGPDNINLEADTQTGGAALLIPNLLGSNDYVMTLGTAQTVTGAKTFGQQKLLVLDNSTHTIAFQGRPQTGNGAILNIPDLAGDYKKEVCVDSNGGILTSNTTLTATDDRSFVVSGNITIDLPASAAVPLDATFWFVKTDAGTSTVFNVTGGDNISGNPTVTLSTQWESVQFKNFPGGWFIVSRSVRGL